MSKDLILAIETGVGGGSLSLLKNDFEIDFWEGQDKISRSEDLLSNISNLLLKNNLGKNDIKKIAVSKGPGSFTGVRVGISTAKGLQKALACACSGVSVLEAMALDIKKAKDVITAFALGKKDVCWQAFEIDDSGIIRDKNSPAVSLIEHFIRHLKILKPAVVVLNKNLYEETLRLKSEIDFSNIEFVELSSNPAKYIGLRSKQIFSTEEIMPLYAREANVI